MVRNAWALLYPAAKSKTAPHLCFPRRREGRISTLGGDLRRFSKAFACSRTSIFSRCFRPCGTAAGSIWLGHWPLADALSGRRGPTAGVDLSSAMLQVAGDKIELTGKIVQGDCLRLPFRPSTFDFLICSFALGHIQDSVECSGRVFKGNETRVRPVRHRHSPGSVCAGMAGRIPRSAKRSTG